MSETDARKKLESEFRDAKQGIVKLIRREFNPMAYESARELTLIGWFNLLMLRVSIFPFFLGEDTSEKLKKSRSTLCAHLLLNPIDTERLEAVLELGAMGYKPVRDLTIEELHSLRSEVEYAFPKTEMELEIRNVERSNNLRFSQLGIDSSFHEKLLEKFKDSSSTKVAHVFVDLGSSDEDLLSGFKSWLDEKRTLLEKQIHRKYTKNRATSADLASWVEKGVIQYLDLQLISELFGIKLTHAQIGNLIFPDELDVDVAERIRKVTIPLVNKITDTDFLNSLQVSAIQLENSRRNEN